MHIHGRQRAIAMEYVQKIDVATYVNNSLKWYSLCSLCLALPKSTELDIADLDTHAGRGSNLVPACAEHALNALAKLSVAEHGSKHGNVCDQLQQCYRIRPEVDAQLLHHPAQIRHEHGDTSR